MIYHSRPRLMLHRLKKYRACKGGTLNKFAGNFFISGVILPIALVACICIFRSHAEGQNRTARGPDPQTLILNNYRKYPDRYIRISGETWKYDEVSRTAFHSFTLKNIAGVAYSDIELRVNYLDKKGKDLQSQVLKIPGILEASGNKKFTNLKVLKVSGECDQAVLVVSKASIKP